MLLFSTREILFFTDSVTISVHIWNGKRFWWQFNDLAKIIGQNVAASFYSPLNITTSSPTSKYIVCTDYLLLWFYPFKSFYVKCPCLFKIPLLIFVFTFYLLLFLCHLEPTLPEFCKHLAAFTWVKTVRTLECVWCTPASLKSLQGGAAGESEAAECSTA